MAVQDRTVLILFGSETGNAQDMAEETGRVCQRLHFKSRVEELNNVDLVRPSSAFSKPNLQLTRITEYPPSIHLCYFCLVNYRPGGHATQFPPVLEKASTQTTSSRLLEQRQVHHVWTGR